MNFNGKNGPWIIALIALSVGVLAYVKKYPAQTLSLRAQPQWENDSLFSTLDRLILEAPALPIPDPAAIRNPFQAPSRPAAGNENQKHVMTSSLRKWKLKGTAGNSVATVLDSAGVKHLMRVGDTLGGVRVLEVHPSRVSMQDEAGRFELELDQ